MKNPSLSVVVPTLNSGRTLDMTLRSIREQKYPQSKIEILVIDGGSTDSTQKVAERYGCKWLKNSKLLQVYAKHKGFLLSKGKYILYLDSDEVLANPESLAIKTSVFLNNKKVRAVIPTGYKTPYTYPSINYYINEFGDPFSFFLYRESKSNERFLKCLQDKYLSFNDNKDSVSFNFLESSSLPLVELCAGGCMIDRYFVCKYLPEIAKKPALIAHLFYLLIKEKNIFAVTKNDPTVHYSALSIRIYLKKIASRVKNNIYNSEMGLHGFVGREQYIDNQKKLMKYLFIPYSFSLLFPLIDSVYLSLSRRQIIYLIHLPLCVYTSFLIIYFKFIKMIGVKPIMEIYGQ